MFDMYLKTVMAGDVLGQNEAYETAKMLLKDRVPAVKAAAMLGALRTRKEQAAELTGFVQALYEEAVTMESDVELLDTCGTGGDGLGTFNISTLAALVVASCGIPVAKHGNKAVTGKVGSADLLEALGVNIMMTPDEARRLLDHTGMTFLFAPLYHPILREIGGLRRELGVATIFNFLGPMLNPFELSYQVMGISDATVQEAVCKTLGHLGRKRALVVAASDGMDEVSPCSGTRVLDLCNGLIETYEIKPEGLGSQAISLTNIQGGDIETSTKIAKSVLDAEAGPYLQTVILNAAVALFTAGQAKDIPQGMMIAREAVESGRTRQTLLNMISYSRDGILPC